MLTEKNITIKQISHDLRNSMFVILSWIYFGEYKKAKIKILELSNSLGGNQISVAGNKIIDSFIWLKIYAPCKMGINFKFENRGIDFDYLNEMDFCVLIGNALDNAVEACEKTDNNKERQIEVIFTSDEFYNIVSVINTIHKPVSIINGDTIKTTKKDYINHGFGLKGIKDIVKKQQGSLSFYQNDTHFFLDISLKKIVE